MTPIQELLNKIIKLDDKFPYKKKGDAESYSSYREGHSDALGAVIGMLEFILDNNKEKEFAKQCFEAGFDYANAIQEEIPNFEEFYNNLGK